MVVIEFTSHQIPIMYICIMINQMHFVIYDVAQCQLRQAALLSIGNDSCTLLFVLD